MITISSLLTVTALGPLAINIGGVVKDVGLTYLGFAFFDDIQPTALVLSGLVVSFLGAAYYSYDKYQASVQPKPTKIE